MLFFICQKVVKSWKIDNCMIFGEYIFPVQAQKMYSKLVRSLLGRSVRIWNIWEIDLDFPDPESDWEFPYQILNFHMSSRISISDLKILYMIQNFLFLSRTSISNPKIPACLIGMPSLWSLKMRCMWIGMVQKDTIISEALNTYFKSENWHFNTGSTKFFTSKVLDRKVMDCYL